MNDQLSVEPIEPQPLPPVAILSISHDRMGLELLFQKQGEPSAKPVYEEVMASIAAKGVIAGINELAIRALCENPVYNRAYVVARGVPAATGKDGELVYHVERSRALRPKIREDGTADYRDLGFIHNVRQGEVLCEIIKPEKGEDGFDVCGNVLEGKLGKDPMDPAGKNTVYNEDGTKLLAACDGSAEVQRGVINVLDVLRINGNVDNSTGDIDFVGDVIILGDVVSGFKVKSQGSISIKGSVEGATIEAQGDVVVGEGINGMNRGSVTAGGTLKCKYIQSSYIKAIENIYADSVMYCTMECGGNVELSGKRATLIGGRATIAGRLIAKTIGTESHVATYITMASTGTLKNQEIARLIQEIKEIDSANTKLLQIMARYDDLAKQGRVSAELAQTIPAVKQNYINQMRQRNELQQRQEQIKQEQLEASQENSYIECKGRIHVGVQIVFGPLTMSVQNSFVYSRVSIIGNEIGISTL